MHEHAPKVLVVDDDPSLQRLMQRILKLNDYQVKIAQDFDDALRVIQSDHCFDIILLDVQFPGGGGLKLLPHLKKECQQATVIVVSATEDDQVLHQLLQEGAEAHVGKPFDVDGLIQCIEHHLQSA